MIYSNAIMANTKKIMDSACGLFVTDKMQHGETYCVFPTCILHTETGKRFDVLGLLQIDYFDGGRTVDCLVFDPKDKSFFFVSLGNGVIEDEQLSEAMMKIFIGHGKKFIAKYNETPMFMRINV